MIMRHKVQKRRGAILVLLTLAIVALTGFVALAIDIGVVAVARNQCQNSADAGAMAGVRTLNGDVANNNNYTNAGPAALAASTSNYVLTNLVTNSMVNIQLGSYSYDTTQQKFIAQIPKLASDNWTLCRVTVSATIPTFFGRIFGIQTSNPTATATAVHRPRDISLILDFSGSMRFDSLIGIPYNGARTKSNNPDPVYPQFGHYSDTATAALQNPAPYTVLGSDTYGSANITVDTAAGPAIVNDFYQHTVGSSAQKAFTAAADGYSTAPGGDNFLHVGNASGNAYAKTVNELTGSTSRHDQFETQGYQFFTGTAFNGYVSGPRYWGKTFFIWPPDPVGTNDWRKRFFFKNDGVTPCDDNTLLWDSTGNWRVPRSNSTNNYYRINYNAILGWLKSSGTNPFPPRLRSGRILYYDAIPDSIDINTFPPTDLNQRFWKDYIDYILGVVQTSGTGYSPVYSLITPYTGYGDDFTWGTKQISAKPTGADTRYMNYNDNPERPRTHFWFGPMTMIDFLGNYNLWSTVSPNYKKHCWWPGTCHESAMWAMKVGIQSSLQDIQFNHPNDWVAMTYFSAPEYSSGNPAYGRFNRMRAPLGRNYSRLIDVLWYPVATIDNPGTELRPYDYANLAECPHAMGGTTPVMGFMQTYNQYSNNSSLATWSPSPAPGGEAGGYGRRGAQKLIILETDGMANTTAAANFVNGGANNYSSYYKVRYPGEYPSNSGTVDTQCYAVVDQIVAMDSASSPGFSTSRKPVLIHCLGFGQLFEPSSTTPEKGQALTLLQTIQYKGKTQANASDPLPDYKMIVGTSEQRIIKLQQAFANIMQDGVQVTLVQ